LNLLTRIFLLVSLLWLGACATPATPPVIDGVAVAPDYALADSNKVNTVKAEPDLPGLKPPVFPSEGLRPLNSLEIDSTKVHELTPPADIWERIRRGFAMPDLQSDLVSDREQWYATRPDYVQRMTERGSKYLFYIVEEIERRRMPSELALLPFIESAFNPQAVSSAKAAGMWQFMPATGRVFDLRQNMFRDDRRDVLASTRAALDYLQKLYNMFGDWQLALAAYNWGEGSVGRAIAKNQKAGQGTSYTDLKMPAETRLYVPKLQAIKNIVANPQQFGLTFPEVGNHPYFQTVDIQRDIDVALAAQLAEVDLKDFKALNPQLSRPVLLAAGTPQILLPWDNAIVFQANLEAYKGEQLASWTAWIAPKTLKPADAAKQVGMSEKELREVNHITGRMLIRAGSTLLVRRGNGVSKNVSSHIANNATLSLAPEVSLRKVVVAAKKKDSVKSLARRYRVSADQVAQWNGLDVASALKLGQKVTLYLPTKASTKGKKSRGQSTPSKKTKLARK